MGRSIGRKWVLATLGKCLSTLDTAVIYTVPVIVPASFSRLSKLVCCLLNIVFWGDFMFYVLQVLNAFVSFKLAVTRLLLFQFGVFLRVIPCDLQMPYNFKPEMDPPNAPGFKVYTLFPYCQGQLTFLPAEFLLLLTLVIINRIFHSIAIKI